MISNFYSVEKLNQCRHCAGLGYDASGLRCTCQPVEPFPRKIFFILVFLTILLLVLE